MSIKVTGRSRTYKIKIDKSQMASGGFRDLTADDRKVWAFYTAY